MNKQNVLLLSLCFSFAGIASDGSEYGGEMSYLDERDLNTIQKLEALDRRQVSAQAVLPGQVIFTYGSGIPTVVCALFEITYDTTIVPPRQITIGQKPIFTYTYNRG